MANNNVGAEGPTRVPPYDATEFYPEQPAGDKAGEPTPSEAATDGRYQAESLLSAVDSDTQVALFDLLQRQMAPRISQSGEVNAKLARVEETCICGATYKLAAPAEFRDDVLKGVNTWRKYHRCGMNSGG